MKTSKIYLFGAMMLGAAALAACSDDEKYDVTGDPGNLVYVDQGASNVTECTLYRTPAGNYGDLETQLSARLQYTVADSVTVTAVADTTLVSAFNAEHETQYATLPADVLRAIAITPAGISAGSNVASAAVHVAIPESARGTLTAEGYVLPVRLAVASVGSKQTDRPVSASQTMATAYLVIHTTSNIVTLTGNNTASCAIVKTPVGVFGEISGSFTATLLHAIGSDVKISATVDNALVEEYNAEHSTSYAALPAEVANTVEVTATTIAAGETTGTVKVTADKEKAQTLSGTAYLLPLRLTATYADGTTQTIETAKVYLTLSFLESLINSNPTEITGTIQQDCSAWECIAATNLYKEEMSFDGWRPTASGVDNASFTVDLKGVHKVSAFMANCYVMQSNGARVYLSTDGNTWTDLGSTSGCKSIRDNNWNSWYVLYGGVSARYVRFDFTLNANSWAWSYADWGYTDVQWGLAFDD